MPEWTGDYKELEEQEMLDGQGWHNDVELKQQEEWDELNAKLAAGCNGVAASDFGVNPEEDFRKLKEFLDREVHQPDHYTVGGMEAIDIVRAKLTPEEFRGFLKGNVLKYIMRSNYKGKHDQDVEKAAWYAEELAHGKKKAEA